MPYCQLLMCDICMLQTAAQRSQPGRSRRRRRFSSSWTPLQSTFRLADAAEPPRIYLSVLLCISCGLHQYVVPVCTAPM